jgi:hypothetical protein
MKALVWYLIVLSGAGTNIAAFQDALLLGRRGTDNGKNGLPRALLTTPRPLEETTVAQQKNTFSSFRRLSPQLEVLRISGSSSSVSVPHQQNIKDGVRTLTTSVLQAVQESCEALGAQCNWFLKHCWWSLPMLLCLIPVYTHAIHATPAVTPSWWKLVSCRHLLRETLHVAAFLGSNISYYAAGVYLLAGPKFPVGLGVGVLSAGTVSTVFHAVQALGDYRLAESLCYLDHGVAISSALYFWHTCGRPSRLTWMLGVAGLVALAAPAGGGDVYPGLHSAWHFLSAGAAVAWALDGKSLRGRIGPPQAVRVQYSPVNVTDVSP